MEELEGAEEVVDELDDMGLLELHALHIEYSP